MACAAVGKVFNTHFHTVTTKRELDGPLPKFEHTMRRVERGTGWFSSYLVSPCGVCVGKVRSDYNLA